MNLEVVAKALKELGHPIRLTIYKSVVKATTKALQLAAYKKS